MDNGVALFRACWSYVMFRYDFGGNEIKATFLSFYLTELLSMFQFKEFCFVGH